MTDLLRFLVRTDGLDDPSEILRADSVVAMTTGATANPRYGRGGGAVTAGSEWNHTGRLGGTESIVAKLATGICYAVIANGNGLDPNQVGSDMAQAIDDWGPGAPI